MKSPNPNEKWINVPLKKSVHKALSVEAAKNELSTCRLGQKIITDHILSKRK